MSLLSGLAVEVPVMLLCACVTAVILWRLRHWDFWLILVGLGLTVVFTVIGWVVAPLTMSSRYHQGTPPTQLGIITGCMMHTLNFLLNRFGLGKGQ